jgi:hypothetical protein
MPNHRTRRGITSLHLRQQLVCRACLLTAPLQNPAQQQQMLAVLGLPQFAERIRRSAAYR